VLGNHDLGGERFNTENYERFLGPTNYSYNYGRWHFIVLPVRPAWESLRGWLAADIAARPKGSHIIVFQHYAPVQGLLDFMAQYDCRAVIHGHWHSTRIFNYRDITTFSTATLRFGGIDTTPGGFRIVTLGERGGVRTEYRYRGLERFLHIAAPGEGARVPRGAVQVAGSAYDTSHGVDLVMYSIAGATGRAVAAGNLARASKLGWLGQAEMSRAATGEYKVSLRASARAVGEWEDAHSFVLVDEDAPRVQAGADWPMFRGDAGRTGVSRGVLRPPLRLAWARSTGGTLNLSSPIVADGSVYVSAQDLDTPDAARAGVMAFSAADGGTRWHYRTDSSVEHSPAYGDGRIFAVSIAGTVYGIDAATGAERWSYKLSGPVERWICSAPLYADGVVYAGHGPTFAALDAGTGEELWRAPSFGRDWIPPDSSPSMGNGLVFLTPQRLPTRALSAETGKVVWSFSAPELAEQAKLSAPKLVCPVRDGVLYAPYGLGFYALDAETGALRWKAPARRGFSSPAIASGAIYIGTTSGKVLCLDRRDGEMRWEFATGPAVMSTVPYQRSAPNVASSPAVSGDVVYVGAGDGKLYALSARDGSALWSYDIGTPICSSPAISGNALYVGAMDGNVYCFVGAT
jgi:outer membrane protein assembly factor BamB